MLKRYEVTLRYIKWDREVDGEIVSEDELPSDIIRAPFWAEDEDHATEQMMDHATSGTGYCIVDCTPLARDTGQRMNVNMEVVLDTESVAREIALRIRGYGLNAEMMAAEGANDEAHKWKHYADELWSLASRLDIYQVVEDELYLMEAGPE